MKIIVNVNKNWGIGKDGDLLCRFKEDMKFFKETTYGNTIICGRKTFESFPHKFPLKGRRNIVLTSNKFSILEESKQNSNFYANLNNVNGRPNSTIIGLSKIQDQFDGEPTSLIVASSVEQILNFIKFIGHGSETYVCGGESIYNLFLPYCNECLVTMNSCEDEADKFFPNLDKLSDTWKLVESSGIQESNDKVGLKYEFRRYKKISKSI